MTLLKTLWFALRSLSRYSLDYAGAEMCGGDTRRARADAYRYLKNMSAAAVQTQVYEIILASRGDITEPAQDRP